MNTYSVVAYAETLGFSVTIERVIPAVTQLQAERIANEANVARFPGLSWRLDVSECTAEYLGHHPGDAAFVRPGP